MLIELRIQNYAVIEQLSVHLRPGLNALTGETGAGKSIIVGALSLLLGERASADVVRAGAQKAVVEGVFDVAARPELALLMEEQGIESADGLLILRREVAAEGRNRAWVNGSAATASLVGQLGALLVDLHGQHEHQRLLHADEQRAILDAHAQAEELAGSVRAAALGVAEAEAALSQLARRRQEAEQRADLLRFQLDEIETAQLAEDEEDRLEEEARRLEHAEELARLASELHAGLYADEESLTSRIDDMRRVLDHLLRIDPAAQESRELLDAAYYNLEEVGRRMADYAAGIEHDPARLDQLQRRRDLIFRLKSKYGPELGDVLETARMARAELDLIDTAQLEQRVLEQKRDEARAGQRRLAEELTAKRSAAAESLTAAMQAALPEVGLAGGSFQIALEPLGDIGPSGAERVEFRVSLNTGFDPRPLARVASGGELSRVMLALKTILASADRVPTLVFDEIDAGIGGNVAVQIAAKLHQVARHHQVFVITHLAQIAARADQQLLVEKAEQEGTTITRLIELQSEDRVRELARMLGGDADSAVSLEHARELVARPAS